MTAWQACTGLDHEEGLKKQHRHAHRSRCSPGTPDGMRRQSEQWLEGARGSLWQKPRALRTRKREPDDLPSDPDDAHVEERRVSHTSCERGPTVQDVHCLARRTSGCQLRDRRQRYARSSYGSSGGGSGLDEGTPISLSLPGGSAVFRAGFCSSRTVETSKASPQRRAHLVRALHSVIVMMAGPLPRHHRLLDTQCLAAVNKRKAANSTQSQWTKLCHSSWRRHSWPH